MADYGTPSDFTFDFNTTEEAAAFDSQVAQEEAKRDGVINASTAKQALLGTHNKENDLLRNKFNRRNQNRSAGEAVGDTALSVAKGAVALGGIAYGAADLVSRYNPATLVDAAGRSLAKGEFTGSEIPSLDEVTGGHSKNFSVTRDFLSSMQSDKTQFQMEEVAEAATTTKDRIEGMRVEGENVVKQFFGEQGEALVDSVVAQASNPLATVDSLVESLPQMFLGGAAGKALTTSLLSKATPVAQKKFLASEVGKKAVAKIATTAGLATVAVTEGMSNGLDAKAEVLNLDQATLEEGSPYFLDLMAQGDSFEDARMKVSNRVFDVTAAISGSVGAVASKLTGAAKFEGSLFTPGSAVGSIITKTGRNAASEGAEETIQGGSGAAAGNVATKLYVDEDQELSEGVGTAAGAGLVVGTASGVAVGGVANTIQGAKDTIQTQKNDMASKAAAKATVDAVVESGDVSTVTDTEASDYELTTSLAAIHERNDAEGTTQEERTKNAAEAVELITKADEKVDALTKKMATSRDPKLQRSLAKEVETLQEEMDQGIERLGAIQQGASRKFFENSSIEKLAKENTPESAARVLGSMRMSPETVSIEEAETLLDNNTISPEEKTEIKDHIKVQKAIQTLDGTNSEIISGGNDNAGISTHQQRISSALELGNTDGAAKALKTLEVFTRGHSQKARDFVAAYKPFQGKPANYKPTDEHQAAIDLVGSTYTTARGKPIQIHRNSNLPNNPLVDTVVQEANALRAAVVQGRNRVKGSAVRDEVSEVSSGNSTERTLATDAPSSAASLSSDKSSSATPLQEEQSVAETTKLRELNKPEEAKPTVGLFKEPQQGGEASTTSDTVIPTADVRSEKENEFSFVSPTPTEDQATKAEEEAQPYPIAESGKGLTLENFNESEQDTRVIQSLSQQGITQKQMAKFLDTPVKQEEFMARRNDNRPDAIKAKQGLSRKGLANDTRAAVDALTDMGFFKEPNTYNMASRLTGHSVDLEGMSPKDRVGRFYNLNMVQQYFTTRREKDTDVSGNILTSVEDFFSSLVDVQDSVEIHLDEPTSIEQVSTLNSMFNFNAEMGKSFKKLFKARASFLHQDYMQYLAGVDGTFDPNVISSIAMGAYNWVATSAGDTLYNQDRDINAIIGRGSKEYVASAARELLGKVGVSRSVLASSIGKDVMKTLGIKAGKDAPGNMKSQLEHSVGLMALHMLQDSGYLTTTEIPFNQIAALTNETEITAQASVGAIDADKQANTDNTVTTFYKVATKQEENAFGEMVDVPIDIVTDIKEGLKAADGIMDKLFSVQSAKVKPSFVSPENVVQTMENTGQKVPENLREIIGKDQARPWTLKIGSVAVHQFLPLESQMELYGYIGGIEGKVHAENLLGKEAANAEVTREIEYLNDHIDDVMNQGEDTPFYNSYNIWKQGRAGQQSNTFNMQTSKIHRHFAKQESFNSEVNLTVPSQVNDFMMAIAEAFDISTDKQMPEVSLQQIRELIQDDEIKAAVVAINKIGTDDINEEQMQQDIMIAVRKVRPGDYGSIEEGAYALDGLVSLAAMVAAQNAGKDTFQSDIFREIDGLTNGPAIGILQLNAGADQADVRNKLERTGMLFGNQDSVLEHITKDSSVDSYVALAGIWAERLKSINASPRVLEAASSLYGDINRNSAKAPLVQTVYGAGNVSIKQLVSDGFISNFYSQIEGAIAETDAEKGGQLLWDLENTVNTLAPNGGFSFPKNNNGSVDITAALQYKMPYKAEMHIREFAETTYGTELIEAIDTEFSDFKEKGKLINSAMDIVFQTYDKMYRDLVTQRQEEMYLSGELIRDVTTLPETEMTIIRERLMEGSPVMHSFFSQQEGKVDTGINVAKFKAARFSGKKALLTEQVYKTPPNGSQNKSSKANATEMEMIAPGVAPTVMGIQGVDAATMFTYLENNNALNVHDAIIVGQAETKAQGQTMNKGYNKVHSEYSVMGAAQDALTRTMALATELDDENGNSRYLEVALTAARENLHEDTTVPKGRNELQVFQVKMANTVREVDLGKLANLEDHTIQGQYLADGTELRKSEQTTTKLNDILDNFIDSLGSTNGGINPDTFQAKTIEAVNAMNSEDVFDNLGSQEQFVPESLEHGNYLRKLLKGSINKVLVPFNLHRKDSPDSETMGATTGLDMYIVHQANGTTPATSGMLVNGIRMSAQEVYLHELVHNVSRAGINGRSVAQRQLKRLHALAKENFTIKDFMANENLLPSDPSYSDEYAAAKARHDHIFNLVSNAPVRSIDETTGLNRTLETADYLHEFMAFGMTNAKFKTKLGSLQSRLKPDGIFKGSLLDIMGNIFDMVVTFITDRMHKVTEATADAQLDALFTQLSNIEQRHKSDLVRSMEAAGTKTIEGMNEIIAFTKSQIIKAAELPPIKSSQFAVVRATGAITALVASDRAKYVANAYQNMRDTVRQGQQGFMNATITEALGRQDDNGTFHDLGRVGNMVIDRQRKMIAESVSETLLKQFKGELTDDQKIAISKAMIKTDLVSLTDAYSLPELAQMLKEGNNDLTTEITSLKNQLNKFGNHRGFYKRSAVALGYYMATGRKSEQHLLLNAKQIADLSGTGKDKPNQDVIDTAEILVDRLASLVAVKYTAIDHRNALSELILSETARNDDGGTATENGITFTLWQHKSLKAESKKRLFVGSNAMVKGYTKEIVNPHIDVTYATENEGDDLAKRMYKREGGPVVRDANDLNTVPVYRYVSRHGGLSTYDAGVTSRTSKVAKGTDTINLRTQAGDDSPSLNGRLDVATIKANKQQAINEMFMDRDVDPTKIKSNFMVPVLNQLREVVSYRYMMEEQTKDSLLQKNNRFEDVMGAMAGNIVDKVSSESINNKSIDALKEQYDKEYSTRFRSYVEIGPRSPDKRLREIYFALPNEARQKVKQVWGGDTMLVRNDLVDMVFGQRKLSVADAFQMPKEEREFHQKMLLGAAELFLGKQAAGKLKFAENIWQEVVKSLKDIIVIKSFIVTAANTVSNGVMLKVLGVPMKNILKHQAEAFSGARAYQKDYAELLELQRLVKAKEAGNPGINLNKEKARVVELKNDLANNPVRELVEAGVYQTVVEDIAASKDEYSYKSKAAQAIDKFTDFGSKTPSTVKKIISNALILQDSEVYKTLNQAAQLSDFVSRYALHKHYTTRAVDPLSKKDSIEKIVNIFINYDLPTHKYTQYGNDMGVVWFSKYRIRILKVMAETMHENPARVFMLFALQGFVGDLPDIWDSSINIADTIHAPQMGLSQIGTINAVEGLL
jgi:hypothetical protein